MTHFPWTSLQQAGKPGNKDIDMYIGSSGGALFCAAMALGYSADEMFDVFMDDQKLKEVGLKRGFQHYLSLNTQAFTQLAKSVRRTFKNGWDPEAFSIMSPVSLKRLEKRLHQFYPTENFSRVAADLFVVTTPLNMTERIVYCRRPKQQEGRVIYRNDANISSAVAASCSLQCFHPLNVRHRNGEQIDLVDGETRKTLSYRLAADNGADLVFVSYTHVPYRFDDAIGSIKKHGFTKVITQSVYLMIQEKILSAQKEVRDKEDTLEIIDGIFAKLLEELPEQRPIIERYRQETRRDLVDKLDFRPGVEYIFIAPDENDPDVFFTWHLGMSTNYFDQIAQKGYQAAKRALERHQFK